MVALNGTDNLVARSLAACRHQGPFHLFFVCQALQKKAKQRPHFPWSCTAAKLLSDGVDFWDFLIIGEEEELLARLGTCSMFSPMNRGLHYVQRGQYTAGLHGLAWRSGSCKNTSGLLPSGITCESFIKHLAGQGGISYQCSSFSPLVYRT